MVSQAQRLENCLPQCVRQGVHFKVKLKHGGECFRVDAMLRIVGLLPHMVRNQKWSLLSLSKSADNKTNLSDGSLSAKSGQVAQA